MQNTSVFPVWKDPLMGSSPLRFSNQERPGVQSLGQFWRFLLYADYMLLYMSNKKSQYRNAKDA